MHTLKSLYCYARISKLHHIWWKFWRFYEECDCLLYQIWVYFNQEFTFFLFILKKSSSSNFTQVKFLFTHIKHVVFYGFMLWKYQEFVRISFKIFNQLPQSKILCKEWRRLSNKHYKYWKYVNFGLYSHFHFHLFSIFIYLVFRMFLKLFPKKIVKSLRKA